MFTYRNNECFVENLRGFPIFSMKNKMKAQNWNKKNNPEQKRIKTQKINFKANFIDKEK